MQNNSAELQELTIAHGRGLSILADLTLFAQYNEMARILSTGTILPDSYRNNPANCLLAMEVAQRLNVPFMSVTQNLNIYNNKPGWSGKYVIAAINSSGRFEPLQFELCGEDGSYDRKCRAFAFRKGTTERVDGDWVTWRMAVDSGWNWEGSPWNTMRDLMFKYRAASFFGNLHCSDFLLGLPSVEEILDTEKRKPAAAGFRPPASSSAQLSDAIRSVELPTVSSVEAVTGKAQEAPAGAPVLEQPVLGIQPDTTPAAPVEGKVLQADAGAVTNVADSMNASSEGCDSQTNAAEAAPAARPTAKSPRKRATSSKEVANGAPEPSLLALVSTSTDDGQNASGSPAASPAPIHAPTEAPTEPPTEAPTAAPSVAQTPAPTEAPQPTAAPQPQPAAAPTATAGVCLAAIKELCMNADSTEKMLKVAQMLGSVDEADRLAAEKEVVEAAMLFIADETTPEGMQRLFFVRENLTDRSMRDCYRVAYNGRVEMLRASANGTTTSN